MTAVTTIPGDSDEELIRDSARGEERAFALLIDRYRSRIVQLVRWQLGTRNLWAEDVAQDVFVQVHRKAGSFEGRSSFKTWLYAVTLNVCRDHRRRERGPARGGGAAHTSDDTLASLPDGSLDPLARLEHSQRDSIVRAAVDLLTPEHRAVLQLRDWEEMSYEQIAATLEVPIGTVRSRLHNARATLASHLAESLKGR